MRIPQNISKLALPLMDEWNRLARRGVIATAICRWQLCGIPDDTSADGLLDALGRDRTVSEDAADALLAELIARAGADKVAARVVLQRVLPGLVTIANRRGGIWEGHRLGAFDDVVASAWIVIREFPIDRRPRRIAANVLRDAEYVAFVKQQRMRSSTEQVREVQTMPLTAADTHGRSVDHWLSPFETIVGVLAEARQRGLTDDELRLAAGLVSGQAIHRIAADLGVSTRTVQNRRASVVARLRSLELAA